MPQIKEILPSGDVPGAIHMQKANAEDVDIGQGLRAFGQGAEEASYYFKQKKNQDDVIAAHKALNDLEKNKSIEWMDLMQKYKADPDPAKDQEQRKQMEQNFIQGLNDSASKIGDNIKTQAGQRYYQERLADFQNRFGVTVHKSMSELAGENAKNAVESSLKDQSTVAMSFPSQFGSLLKSHQEFAQKLADTGALPQVKADEWKEKGARELAISAVQGWVNLSPEEAKNQLDRGTYDQYFSGHDKEMMYMKVDQAVRAREAQDEHARRLKHEEQQEQWNKTTTSLYDQILTAKPEEAPAIKKSIINSGLPYNYQENLIRAWKMQAEKAQTWRSDPHTVAELERRIDLPFGDPQKITNPSEVQKLIGTDPGHINLTDGQKLMHYMSEGTPERKQARQQIQNYATQIYNAYARVDASGIPESHELAMQGLNVKNAVLNAAEKYMNQGADPHELLNPRSKYYLGHVVHAASPNAMDRLKAFMHEATNFGSDEPANRFSGRKAKGK